MSKTLIRFDSLEDLEHYRECLEAQGFFVYATAFMPAGSEEGELSIDLTIRVVPPGVVDNG